MVKTAMGQKNQQIAAARQENAATVRATISFPTDLYETLEDIAKRKKVSLAWVVRDATEQYVTDRWPLLAKNRPESAVR
jgi:metal-responsive CopG/Arc/MetJ family transcriptional regulator